PVHASHLESVIVQSILREILLRPGHFIAESTTDDRLASISPDAYVPGYLALMEDISERSGILRSNRVEIENQLELERRREEYSRRYVQPMEDSAMAILDDIAEDGPVVIDEPQKTIDDRQSVDRQAEEGSRKIAWAPYLGGGVGILVLFILGFFGVRHVLMSDDDV
ncbi:MAG: hypothetical protein ACIAXF_05925, partial [Phycisphaerales bacterium JB063]